MSGKFEELCGVAFNAIEGIQTSEEVSIEDAINALYTLQAQIEGAISDLEDEQEQEDEDEE